MRDVVNRYMANTRESAFWAMNQDDRVQNVLDMAEETFFFAASFPSEGDSPFLNTLSQWVNQRLARWRNELAENPQEEPPWWETTTKDKVEKLTLFQVRLNEKMEELDLLHP